MKKLIAQIIVLASTLGFANGPLSQMGDYQPTNVDRNYLNTLWNQMETNLKGDDCYRRAQIWAVEMYERHRIKSKKIFIHYTDKWNRELDNMGGELSGNNLWSWGKRKRWDADGISKSLRGVVRGNITWDYHVAPMLVVDGEDVVMDRYLKLPYDATPGAFTEKEFFKQIARPATPEEWVEALTANGEMLWKARKAKLIEQRKEAKKDLRKSTEWLEKYGDSRRSNIQSQIRRNKIKQKDAKETLAMVKKAWVDLEMDQAMIDIKCEKIESIATLDKNHENAWCFYSEAPMYYYNELDLRYLAYGNTSYSRNYNSAPPLTIHTEANYRNGIKYIQTRFNPEETKDAQKERKRSVHDDNDW